MAICYASTWPVSPSQIFFAHRVAALEAFFVTRIFVVFMDGARTTLRTVLGSLEVKLTASTAATIAATKPIPKIKMRVGLI